MFAGMQLLAKPKGGGWQLTVVFSIFLGEAAQVGEAPLKRNVGDRVAPRVTQLLMHVFHAYVAQECHGADVAEFSESGKQCPDADPRMFCQLLYR